MANRVIVTVRFSLTFRVYSHFNLFCIHSSALMVNDFALADVSWGIQGNFVVDTEAVFVYLTLATPD